MSCIELIGPTVGSAGDEDLGDALETPSKSRRAVQETRANADAMRFTNNP